MKRLSLRLLAAGLMFACLAGPAPGNVGGCAAERSIADPREHCQNTEYWKCYRDFYAGRITSMADYQACLLPIRGTCSAAAWPDGCEPTQTQSDACVILLSREDYARTFTTPELLMTFDDCNLCE